MKISDDACLIAAATLATEMRGEIAKSLGATKDPELKKKFRAQLVSETMQILKSLREQVDAAGIV